MILVVGGTGELGGRVVRLLRAKGHDVRCLLRWQTDDSRLRETGAEIVRGDLTDPPSLNDACRGAASVVATATAIVRRLEGTSTATIRQVDEEGMASLVKAAETARVQRFVYVSYAGVGSGIGTALEHAKQATESLLAETPIQRVVIRPDSFQEIHLGPVGRFDMTSGKAVVIGKGDNRIRFVATDDVAALISSVVLEPEPPSVIEFGGPEALSKNEAVEIAGELLGHRMKVQRVPRPLARLAIRLLARPNDAMAAVFGNGLLQDTGDVSWDDQPLRQRGIVPRSASDFLHEQAQRIAARAGE
ncbi:SDR family oxidoreductase [Sinomonas notoginsengisoli]|uniref:SDR family oxidoreductase n=1 Tax=Sinomonas notoginsengisoli TaxID=1457311 RepID=UPI001F3D3A46|nr:NAD(P)H-binding protein [Sinomonas notoginsengisoli]